MTTESTETTMSPRIVEFTEDMIEPVLQAVEAYLEAVHGDWNIRDLAVQLVDSYELAGVARAAQAANRSDNFPSVAMSRHEGLAASRIVHLMTAQRCRMFRDRLEYTLVRLAGREVGVRNGFIEVVLDELARLAAKIDLLRDEFLSRPLTPFAFNAYSESGKAHPRDVLIERLGEILV